jgi:hypothetical protein
MAERVLTADGDEAVIATIDGVVAVHRNTTSWYNNASFALPLLATIVAALAGAVLRNLDVLAFAGFLLVVTLLMVPVVLTSWRHSATAVVLTRDDIRSLHAGRTLASLRWPDVTGVERRETQGNVRWLVQGANGQHITLEGELDNLDALLRATRRLAELPEET